MRPEYNCLPAFVLLSKVMRVVYATHQVSWKSNFMVSLMSLDQNGKAFDLFLLQNTYQSGRHVLASRLSPTICMLCLQLSFMFNCTYKLYVHS